jgi:dCMP deaminase
MDKFNRPDWDSYFISLCFMIAQRSIDQHTKHGCIVVDSDKTILSVGYNGAPRGCDDSIIPLTRPEKYEYLEHSEANAIINAARTGTCLKGSTFYITGCPCHNCFRKIMGVGAKKIVYGPQGSAMLNEEDMKIINVLNAKKTVEIVQYYDDVDMVNMAKLFDKARDKMINEFDKVFKAKNGL